MCRLQLPEHSQRGYNFEMTSYACWVVRLSWICQFAFTGIDFSHEATDDV